MTLQHSPTTDIVAFRHWSPDSWATGHNDGPPEDWDEIRARLRALHQAGRGRRRHGAETVQAVDTSTADLPGADALAGSGLVRVSWRPADVLAQAGVMTLLAWLYGALAPATARRWWQQHNPLLVQRLLVVVALLLLLNLIVAAFS